MEVQDELREYEGVVLMHPEMSEEKRGKIREQIENSIKEHGGEILRVEIWGRKVLAYEIDHLREAFYLFYLFRMPPKGVRELQKMLSLKEEITRFKIFQKARKR
ncbi:MAG: 30S ribosomal protein S6 [bacterium JZ-2024 1]